MVFLSFLLSDPSLTCNVVQAPGRGRVGGGGGGWKVVGAKSTTFTAARNNGITLQHVQVPSPEVALSYAAASRELRDSSIRCCNPQYSRVYRWPMCLTEHKPRPTSLYFGTASYIATLIYHMVHWRLLPPPPRSHPPICGTWPCLLHWLDEWSQSWP